MCKLANNWEFLYLNKFKYLWNAIFYIYQHDQIFDYLFIVKYAVTESFWNKR